MNKFILTLSIRSGFGNNSTFSLHSCSIVNNIFFSLRRTNLKFKINNKNIYTYNKIFLEFNNSLTSNTIAYVGLNCS